jgi:hypothetical protein
MVETKRGLIFAYILLVGAPLLGLAGIVAAGQQVRAPALIAGAWTVECRMASGDECPVFPRAITISQAGPRVTVFGNAGQSVAAGTIDGSLLRLELAGAEHSCGEEILVRISGRPHQRRFEGHGVAAEPAACAAIHLRGVQTSRKRTP